LGGALWAGGGGTLTTVAGSTVNYDGANQTVAGFTYTGNLTLSGSGTVTLQTATTSVGGNMTLSGTVSVATVVGLTISGNLSIGNGTTFNAAGFALTVTGTTAVGGGTTGFLNITSATGAKLFTGLITINPGGTWNNSGNSAVEVRGGITNNGTFTAGTGVYTFDTNTQTLTGTFSIPSVTVTGVTLNNSGTLTVGTALSGSGGLTQGTGATLNIGGTSGITTLTATASPNTVNYTGAGQTVHNNNYYNLTLSGSGTDVLGTSTTAISGNMTLSGSVSVATVVGLTISGNLSIGDGTTFNAAGFALTVTGTTTVGGGTTGFLNITSATGAKLFTGLITINPGGTWNNSGNSAVEVRGGITNNGTFTAGTGVYTFDTNTQTLTGTFSIPSVTVTGVTLNNSGTLTVGTALSGSGGLTQGTGATLNIGGTSGITTLTATASPNTVNYTGTSQTLKVVTYYNLTLSGSGATAATGVAVNGTLDFEGSATLSFTGTATANSLTFIGVTQAAGTWGSATSGAPIQDTHFASTGLLTVSTGVGPLAKFAVTTPGTQTAGTAFNITTITAQDAGNNTVTSFTGTVNLTETGGGAGGTVTPSQSSAFAAGVLSGQSVTLSKSGTLVTITATDHAGSGKTGVSGTFTVNAGAATTLAITSVNGGSNPTAGTAFSVVVQSQDANGNAANVVANTGVGLSLNTGTGTLGGTLTGTITAGSSSVTISGVTYTKAESGVILTATRTSGDSLTAGNSGAFTVNPGALDHFAISAISSPQTAGTAITGITLTAQDVNNNTATSFTTTVAYSGTAGITGTSAAFTLGVLSGVSVTPTVAGNNLTFIVTGSSKTGTAMIATINPGAIASYSVTATTPQTRGTAFPVTVTAKDSNGNTVTTDSSTQVTMTSSTTNVQFTGNPATLSSGTFTISALDNYFENVTLTATDGNTKTGTSSSIAVNPLNGDFASRASAAWSATTTWSNFNGTAWINATTVPTSTTTGEISIQGGFTVTVGASTSVPLSLFVVNSGSTVSIGSGFTLTVGNGLANGVISGSGILAENGTATVLDLNGANTYSGGTVITSGTVSISSDGNLGNTSGGITFGGGTLQTTGSTAVTTTRTITLTSGAVLSLGAPLYLEGTITGGTGLTTSGNDLIMDRSSGNNAIGPITVNGNRLFVFTLGSVNASTIAVHTGAILDFDVSGGATPANTITFDSGAGVANRTGTLTLSTATASFPTSGTMIFNSDDQASTAITVSGAYPALAGPLTIQVGGQNATVGTVTLSGAISGTGGLTKTSTGELILGSANTYTGGTTVSAGTLDAHVAGSLGTRDVNVASGAVLMLDTSTGMSTTALLLLSGATPNVTLATGINQTVGGLSFDGGATFQATGTWGNSGKTHNDAVRFSGTGTLTVSSPIAITVTAASNTKTYDGTTSAAAIPTLTSGTLAAGDTATYSETYSTKDVGTGNKTLVPAVTIKDSDNVDVTASYNITLTSITTGTITPKALTVLGITAASTVYDGTTTAKLGGTAAFQTPEAPGNGNTSDGIPYNVDSVSPGTVTGTLAAKDVGTENVTTSVAVTGTGNGNYTVTPQAGLTQQVTAKALTVSGITAASTTYDGTTTAKLGGAAAFQTAEAPAVGSGGDGKPYTGNGDAVSPGTVTGTLAAKDVGTENVTTSVAVTGTGNGNYTVTPQAGLTQQVTPKALTVSGITAASTTYDGTTTAKLGGAAAFQTAEAPAVGSGGDGKPYTGNGDAVSPGTVTGTLAAKDVGTENVTTSVAVTGTGNGNYTVTPQAGLTQQVTAKALTVSGITAASTTYDGTTTAKLGGTAAFQAAEAPAVGTGGDGKPYTGNGDAVSIAGAAAGTLAAKDVGTRGVTITGNTVTGTGSGNYTVTQQAGLTQQVTQKALTVSGITAASTTYDGTTTAKLGGTAAFQAAEAPAVGTGGDGKPYTGNGDAVSISGTAAGTLAAKDVGTEAVTITGNTVTGTGSGNYTVTQQTGLTQQVTPKALTVSGITAASTTYDGTTTAKLGGTAAFQTAEAPAVGTGGDGIPYTGNGDAVSPGTVTGTLAAKDVGTENVTTSVAVTGTGNGNYTVTPQAGLTQQVTPKALTVSGITAASTTYDGTTTAKLGGTAAFQTAEAPAVGTGGDGIPYTGNGDAVSPGTVTGTLAAKDVGTENVTTSVAVTGAGNGNYTVTPQAGLTQQVTPKALTVAGNLSVPGSKGYDGTPVATVSGSAALQTAESTGSGSTSDGKPYTGNGDVVGLSGTVTAASYNSKDVNTATTVTFDTSGLSLSGTGFGNYTMITPVTQAATITPANTTAAVALTSGTNPSLPTNSLTFTATISPVSSPATPTGTVQFKSNGNDLGTPVTVDPSGVAQTPSITASNAGHGNLTITAVYVNTDGNFSGITGTLSPDQVVDTPPVGGTHSLVTAMNTPLNVSASTLGGLDFDADGDPLTVSAVTSPSANGGTVSLSSGTVTYTPPSPTFAGADTFTYTISDGFLGGTATSTANVTVNLSGPATSIIKYVSLPSPGIADLRAYGIPGHTYDVQRSPDMITWTTISTSPVTAAPNGIVTYEDDSAPATEAYYRLAVH